MGKPVIFRYSITPMWGIVEKIRDKVEALLSSENDEIRYVCKMASSELIENAVKYGHSPDQKKGIDFSLHKDQKQIVIKVTSGIKSMNDFEKVKVHVDKIKSCDNPQELYIQRLTELMKNPKPGQSQLGLYRIAYEGEFMLEYEINDMLLTLTAFRHIPK